MKIKHINIPVFIPELACPFQCVFCNQQKISGQKSIPNEQEINQLIQTHLSSIDFSNTKVQIAFFGGSFTALPLNEQKIYLNIAKPFLEKYPIHGVRISTRPDYISEDNLLVLKEFGVKNIELGAQSLDDEVLKKSGRGHSVSDVENAVYLLKKNNFEFGLQMMIGLPGDSEEKAISTAKKIIDSGAGETRIYPTLVIEGTQLHKMYSKKEYFPLELDDAVRISSQLYNIFEDNQVKVLRIGLHPSTELETGKSLIAGPFHPKFKELVMSYQWKQRFLNLLSNEPAESLTICTHPSQINYAIGFESGNRNMLKEKFRKVQFLQDTKLTGTQFNYDIN